MNTHEDPLLTKEDVAKYLKVTERTVLDWAQREIIPAIKLAGSWRFRREAIDSWLESNRTGPDTAAYPDNDVIVHPQPFRSAERERNIKSCIRAIESSMLDTDREEWPILTFQIDHGVDIANEAIACLVKARKGKLDIRQANGQKYEVIKRRKR